MEFEKQKFAFECKQRELDREDARKKEERQNQFARDQEAKFDKLFDKMLTREILTVILFQSQVFLQIWRITAKIFGYFAPI